MKNMVNMGLVSVLLWFVAQPAFVQTQPDKTREQTGQTKYQTARAGEEPGQTKRPPAMTTEQTGHTRGSEDQSKAQTDTVQSQPDKAPVQKVWKGMRYNLVERDPSGAVYPIPEGTLTIVDLEAQLSMILEPINSLNEADGWETFPKTTRKTLDANPEITVKAVVIKPSGEVQHLHINGYDQVADKKLALTWHELDDLRAIHISMGSSKWKPGNRLSLSLLIRNSKTKEEYEEITYYLKAQKIGLYRGYTTGMVFSEPMDGDNRNWSTNIMTQVNWYYDIRNPDKGGRVWNWMGMGSGLHLASLNHDTSGNNVEFGIGGNIALWEGLVSFGMGYNLMTKENYKFVTIDLFDILDGKVGD